MKIVGFLLAAKITGVMALLYTCFIPASSAEQVRRQIFFKFKCADDAREG